MKKAYAEQAQFIPNWKDLTKTELCNLYIDHEDDSFLRDCYFSAIILNYWNKIYKLQQDTYLTASLEDTYQWVVDGILYALNHRKWRDPNNKLFSDPDAPDKVINRKIKCIRINYLISQNRTKRKVHVNLLSLDSFDDSENFIGEYTYKHNFVRDAIIQYCKDKKYIEAIILDLIAFGDCQLDECLDDLIDLTCDIDELFLSAFSEEYKVDETELFDIFHKQFYKYSLTDLWGYGECYVKKSRNEISKIVTKKFEQFKKDENLKALLVC